MTDLGRVRKLRIRSWRRGTREMDLLLGQFADEYLANMSDDEVELYEDFLDEGDPQISDLLFGHASTSRYGSLVDQIRRFHGMDQGRKD